MFGKLQWQVWYEKSQSFGMSDWSIQKNMTNVKYIQLPLLRTPSGPPVGVRKREFISVKRL